MSRATSVRAARPRARAVGLPCLLAIVTVQVLINYHTWLISGPDHLYYLRGLNHHPLPYIDARIEYPVLTGVFMTLSAALTHGIQGYLRLNSVLLGACALGCTCILWSICRRAAIAFALCPLLLVFSLANWDLFAILLMLLGWRAYRVQHHAAAGAWLALGVFAKLFPVFLLGACAAQLIARWHAGQDPAARGDLARFGGAAVAASALVNLPFAVPAFHNWLWFWSFNARRDDHASLLAWLHILDTASITTTNVVLTAVVLIVAAIGAVAIWRGTAIARVAALVFLVFMVLEKVYSPQYTLWIVAYALLADWDLWTIVALSLIGLVDDANAAVHIALVHDHASQALTWFDRTIAPREQGFRLLGSIAIAGAMLAHELLPSQISDSSQANDRPRATAPAGNPGWPAGAVAVREEA